MLKVSETREPAKPTTKSYLVIWAALVLLTGLTVTMASLNLGRAAIFSVLAIAALKSSLVLFYFMHLRYEGRLLIRLLVPIVLATLAIFIGLTYTDILYR
ncbi:MAG TPA: cytochrome C oxidase subunit IV family protein [Rectinemataceae bacterium]|nr:cytochrome C oxidase subunit IV family protein [Rectinemataceae bacterium]